MRLVASLCTAALFMSTAAVRAQQDAKIVDDLLESPTFFEMFSEDYSDEANRDLFREGKIRLHPLGVHDIGNFDWKNHERRDKSWWIRLERFEYMNPIFDSDADLDRDLARLWVQNWLDVHETNIHPNLGSRDAMGVGMRAMMLARYIRHLDLNEPDQADLSQRLRVIMRWHQDFLKLPKNFNTDSNHGMWESMGLFETTRVVPDTAVTRLALDRLMTMVSIGVSDKGIEREHSVSYHFYFFMWLSDFTAYLQSLERLRWDDLRKLAAATERMRRATWYMYDHEMQMPQIGDTDDERAYRVVQRPREPNPVLFDEQAGFAIYKDPDRGKHKRFVVFCIQNEKNASKMRYHLHNDMMAVYYNYDGEVILGDGGRYTYSTGKWRTFYMSSKAHNVILPSRMLKLKNTSMWMAQKVSTESNKKEVAFHLQLPDDMVTRTVRIPHKRPELRVRDRLVAKEKHVALWNLGMDVSSFGIGDSKEENGWRVHEFHLRTNRGRRFTMRISVRGGNATDTDYLVYKGSNNPKLGWYSPDYNMSWPTPVIVVNMDVAEGGEMEVMTEISLDG
jgi:hypothetical protein